MGQTPRLLQRARWPPRPAAARTTYIVYDASLAAEGIRSLAEGLPRFVTDLLDLDGREHVLYAAYLSAVAFASVGSVLHHKICHVLGGVYNLPHAQTHAIVLPYVLAFNAPAVRMPSTGSPPRSGPTARSTTCRTCAANVAQPVRT